MAAHALGGTRDRRTHLSDRRHAKAGRAVHPLFTCARRSRSDGYRPRAADRAGVPVGGAFDRRHLVIIYDRDDPPASSVLWHLFRAFGHRDTCILDGGYAAWRGASGELASRYGAQGPGTWCEQKAETAIEAVTEILRFLSISLMA